MISIQKLLKSKRSCYKTTPFLGNRISVPLPFYKYKAIMANFQNSINKISQAIKYLEHDAPVIMGVEAVNHFKESFEKQGFTDTSLKKWDEVERRKAGSPWRGFQYGSTVSRPGKKRRKPNSQTNYSPAAEKRPILSGQSQELMHSIEWRKQGRGVIVTSNTPYSKIQNEGGQISIFGKAQRNLKQRQFMGKSQVLRDKIRAIIYSDLKRILK